MFIAAVLVITVLCYLLVTLISKQIYIRKKLSTIPGPSREFFMGNAWDFIGNKDMLSMFIEYTKKYGGLVRGQVGPLSHGLVVTDYEFTKQFLLTNANLSKGVVYKLTKAWLGEGLITSDEKKWRPQRKMLAPAFSNTLLLDYISIFDQQSNILVEKFMRISPMDSFEISKSLSLCSLDVICESAMGVSINAQKNENGDYVQCVRQMCEIITNRSMSLGSQFYLIFMLTPEYQKQRRCLRIIKNYTKDVLNKRREEREKMRRRGLSEKLDEFGRRKKLALLDILLEYSEKEKVLTEKEIEDEIHTFMFAGHDTVSATMDFMIYELSKNPEIQNLAYQEQLSVFGNRLDNEITYNDLQEMKYLDQVIKETLRKYPPVSVIGRVVSEEFKFKDHIIPVGAILIFHLFGLHRDPNLFANPEEFDPSRFNDPDAISPFSFIPFSTGPRNCIGQKFAMYEIKVIMSKLLRNFEFYSAVPEHFLDLRAEVVLTSRNGVKVGIKNRTTLVNLPTFSQ